MAIETMDSPAGTKMEGIPINKVRIFQSNKEELPKLKQSILRFEGVEPDSDIAIVSAKAANSDLKGIQMSAQALLERGIQKGDEFLLSGDGKVSKIQTEPVVEAKTQERRVSLEEILRRGKVVHGSDLEKAS